MLLTRQEFVRLYYNMAAAVSRGTGIFPETLLAIAIVESQAQVNGRFYPGQSILVKRANNYFGIKYYPQWTGKTVEVNTPNDADKVSRFVVYNSTEDSFRGFIKFLQQNPRYARAGVFNAPTYPEQILAIARAGYAESGNYASVITNVANFVSDLSKSIKQVNNQANVIVVGLVVAGLLINKFISND